MTRKAAVFAAVIVALVALAIGGCVTGGTATYSIHRVSETEWTATVTSDKDTKAALIQFVGPDGKTTLIVQGLDSNGSTLGAQQAQTIAKQTDALVTIIQEFAPFVKALIAAASGPTGLIVPATQPGK